MLSRTSGAAPDFARSSLTLSNTACASELDAVGFGLGVGVSAGGGTGVGVAGTGVGVAGAGVAVGFGAFVGFGLGVGVGVASVTSGVVSVVASGVVSVSEGSVADVSDVEAGASVVSDSVVSVVSVSVISEAESETFVSLSASLSFVEHAERAYTKATSKTATVNREEVLLFWLSFFIKIHPRNKCVSRLL